MLVWSQSAHADWISLIKADACETIMEFFVENDRIRLQLEIGAEDLQYFPELYILAFPREGTSARELNVIREGFFKRSFIVRADDRVLPGSVKTLEVRKRTPRASLYTGVVDSTLLEKEILYAELEYTLDRRPGKIAIRPPIPEDADLTRANIGFICYHKGLPVNDLRYLVTEETMVLDWSDPWYTAFLNRNIARHHRSSLMSFLYIEPYEVRHEVLVRVKELSEWLEFNKKVDDKITVAEQPDLKKLIGEFLLERNIVKIDGVPLEPNLDRLDFVQVALSGIQIMMTPVDLDYSSAIVGVIFSYPTDTLPQQVTVDWDLWTDKTEQIPCMMTDPAGGLPYDLTPGDTQLVWKNFLKNFSYPTVEKVNLEAKVITFPYASVLVLVFLIISIYTLRKEKTWKYGLWILLLGAAWLMRNYQLDVTMPFKERSGLSEEESGAMMTTLLKNTYRAFEYHRESDVYDKLAISIEGELLSDIYLQTRRSMVIAEQGGIEATVKAVNVKGVEQIDRDRSATTYATTWDVMGNVGHWGHIHQRQNQYIAEVTVDVFDGSWKITDMEIIEEMRTD